jgi:heat shock protein HslJ
MRREQAHEPCQEVVTMIRFCCERARWLALFLVFVALAGCIGPAPREPLLPGLVGSTWRVTRIGEQVLATDAGSPRITLRFDALMLGGDAPCNAFSAGYGLDDQGVLQVQAIRASKRACADLALEQMFFDTLARADRLARDGDRLTLGVGDRVLLNLVEVVAP